jgi:organic radical activating enzyme
MSLENKEIKLSESFYSIQGEGITNGVTSYFIRLYNCNLACGGLKGELMARGKASWVCDSIPSWTKFKPITNEGLVEKIDKEGKDIGIPVLDRLISGVTHFIFTGGEPTMPHNRETILSFIQYWSERFPNHQSYYELETNGTIFCPPEINGLSLYDIMHQINSSVKLANSGMRKGIRVVPEAIKQIAQHRNHWWKIVVNCTNEESAMRDIMEFESDYLNPYNLDKRNIILMPGVDNREALPEVTKILFEVSKKTGYRGVTRNHILAWDRCLGV